MIINLTGTTYNMSGDFNIPTEDLQILGHGIFNTNNFNITCGFFYGNTDGSSITYNFGTSVVTILGENPTRTFSNFELDTGNHVINGSSATFNFTPLDSSWPVAIGPNFTTNSGTGFGTIYVNGAKDFDYNIFLPISTLTILNSSGTVNFSSDITRPTTIGTLNLTGSVGNNLIISNNLIAPTVPEYIIVTTAANCSYLTVQDNVATGAATPIIDVNGINGGASFPNSGWIFPPIANFAASPTSGNIPLLVNFTDTSTENPTSWAWNFSVGSSTTQNPNFTFLNGGNFTIKLTVMNAAGSSSKTRVAYITVTASNEFLQIVQMVGSDPDGDVQTINAGKSDDGTPIYYELETQELEFGNRAALNKIADKLTVFGKYTDSTSLQAQEDDGDYKDIPLQMDKDVNIGKDVNLEAHYLTFRWFGESTTEQPIIEGLAIENITDEGITNG